MGLAGRKQKQRIPADPRNLSWADDASRFGLSYLSKFGWDASQGLGTSGDGMKTHLKVQHKLDMMGIGAQHQRDPNGIAWKQNKDFEALLKKLNESAEREKGADDGEIAKTENGEGDEMVMSDKTFAGAQEEKVEGTPKDESPSVTIKKKRKHKDKNDPDTSESTRKKRKKENHQKSESDISSVSIIPSSADAASVPSSSDPSSERIPKPRPMAHRARIRAAKRIAGKSASAISEILGISPPSSASTSTATPASISSSSSPAPHPDSSLLSNLTTSTKSVADYFKEKLLARSNVSSAPLSSTPSGSATPALGGLSAAPQPDDECEPPRRGIGRQFPAILPLSKVPEPGSTPTSGDADDQNKLTEKLRRKAERKAEKRKRREAEANQLISENMSAISEEQVAEDGVETVEGTSKKEKKKKRREERKQQTPASNQSNSNDDDITKKNSDHSSPGVFLPELNMKPKKEHKKKHP